MVKNKVFQAARQRLSALADRPLIWLLPIYAAGVFHGWGQGGGHYARPLWSLMALVSALAALSVFLRNKPYLLIKIAAITLVPAAFLLGFGLASLSVTPPDDPSHLFNFTSHERYPAHVIVGGVVRKTEKRPDNPYQRLIIDSRELLRPGPDSPDEILAVHGLVAVTVGTETVLSPGDYVRLPLVLRRVPSRKNPGAVDQTKLLGAQGIWVTASVKSPALISSWPAFETGFLSPLRDRAAHLIYSRVPPPASGLLASMLLGRRAEVDGHSETVFRNLGLSHILAVSGLHLGLWYGLCLWLALVFVRKLLPPLMRKIAPNLWLRLWTQGGLYSGRVMGLCAVAALVPALFYACLVGPSSPVVRASIMVAAAALALAAKRGADSWNILAAAAWILLINEPYRLFTASFQMSFVATCAMVAVFRGRPTADEGPRRWWNRPVTPGLIKALITRAPYEEDWPNRPRPFFRQLILAALAGTLGTAPLVVWHFSWLPAAGIPGNVIFGPILSALVLIPGLLALMALPLSPVWAGWLMDFSGQVLMFFMPVMDQASMAAGPGLLLPIPGPIFVAAYFLAGWIILRGGFSLPRRLAAGAAVIVLGLLPHLITGPGYKDLRFTVLNVGQGGAIHINFPDRTQMIIDGGGSQNFDPGERIILPYLLRQGLTRLDVAALTHPDEDHLKGLISLCRNLGAAEIWENPWPADTSALYGDFLSAAGTIPRADLDDLRRGRNFGPVRVELLWPPPWVEWSKPQGGGWSNNMSLVLKVSWGEVSFLVTGDIEKKTERELVKKDCGRLASTVLTAPHHGSSSSMSAEFMACVKPRYVVFSAGAYNRFGHPHPRSLKAAQEAGAEIRRTDQDGAAVFQARENGGRVELILK